MSQLDLALEADISCRHLSFIETGRSQPSREMVDRIGQTLNLPLRERNLLLVAAGYAPRYPERPFVDASLDAAREAVERIIECHMPFPALAVDRHWNLVTGNAAVQALMAGAARHLLEPPINVLRLTLHPEGLASSIVNLAQWKHHLLGRLRQQFEISGDAGLKALADEFQQYPAPASAAPMPPNSIAVPLVMNTPLGRLSFISTTTVFGTPVEVTLSEIAVESFFPADADTADRLRQLQQAL